MNVDDADLLSSEQLEQQVVSAIEAVQSICTDSQWKMWAEDWIAARDRTVYSAKLASHLMSQSTSHTGKCKQAAVFAADSARAWKEALDAQGFLGKCIEYQYSIDNDEKNCWESRSHFQSAKANAKESVWRAEADVQDWKQQVCSFSRLAIGNVDAVKNSN